MTAMLYFTSFITEREFESNIFYSPNGDSLLYRIYIPKKFKKERNYPLVLFFHGAGERGNDNVKQLTHGVEEILTYSKKNGIETFILAPQCPENKQWVDTPWDAPSHTMSDKPSSSMQLVLQLLDELIAVYPLDINRLYVTGLSMGGFAVWDIIQRFPDKFAAAVPVCGGGDASLAYRVKDVPIWAFHGDQDKTILPKRSRDMINAIKLAGGNPIYTEYKGVAHDSWTKAYANQEMLNWMFSQNKTNKKRKQ